MNRLLVSSHFVFRPVSQHVSRCGPLCRLLRLPLCLRLSRAFAHVSPNLFPTLSPNFVSICLAILPPCVFHLVPNLPPSSFVAVSPALSFTVSPLCPPLCSPECLQLYPQVCLFHFVGRLASTLYLTVSSALSPACLPAWFSLFGFVPATLSPPTLSPPTLSALSPCMLTTVSPALSPSMSPTLSHSMFPALHLPVCVSALSLVFSPMHRAGFRQKGGSPALFLTAPPPTTPRNNISSFEQFTPENNITMSFRLLHTCLANVVFQMYPKFLLELCI